jgi:signal recognition particle subunit SRP54
MVLDSLGSSLQNALSNLSGERGDLSEEDVQPIIKEIQRALLESDVEVDVVMEVSDNIKNRAVNTEPAGGVTAKDHVLKIVYEELTEIVGDSTDIPLERQTILLAGLQGAGKTTTSAKMAWWFEKKGLRSGIVQTDTQRPGAHQQSRQLSEEADILCSTDETAEDAVKRAREGVEEINEADVKIVDTAGRHGSEEELINEIESISEEIEPDLSILVLDAGMGQSAEEQARKFNNSIGIDGVVITKMDGSAKGGGSLTAVKEANASIAFLGTGEGVRDIERFEPDGFVSRLLGMGDLKQLSERVERAMHEMDDDDWSPEDALEGDFTLYDMKKQMEAMDNMGRMQDILKRMPGMGGGLLDQMDDELLETQEQMMDKFSIMMNSMTEKEMQNPDIIKSSRIERIAKGSGTDIEEVEQMLSQYDQMRGFFGQIDGKGDIKKMADRFDLGGGIGPF